MDAPEIIKIMLALEVPFLGLLIYFHKQNINRLDKNYQALVENNRSIEKIIIRHDTQLQHNKESIGKAHERIDGIKEDIYKFHGSS